MAYAVIALIICVLALVFACVVILHLVREIDKNQKHYVSSTTDLLTAVIKQAVVHDQEATQVIKDLELAVELLHTELERTHGGTHNQ